MPSTASRCALLLAFVAVHFGLGLICLASQDSTFGDVAIVYHDWVQGGLDSGGWVGLDSVWVYPTAALAPMLAASAFGMAHFSIIWLAMVGLLDITALWVLTCGGSRHLALGWWWTSFLMLLGPVAIGRIDAVTVPLAIVGVVLLARRPLVASALFTLAAWIKIWPAALVAAMLVAGRRRAEVLIGAIGVTLAVVVGAMALGADAATLTGFVGQQTGRGLQVEAPVSTLWLWLAAYGVGGVEVAYNDAINTFEVTGPGSTLVSAAMTPLMACVAVVVAGLALVGRRRGISPSALFGPLGLALVSGLIVTNKVGSPQFESWLAVPVLAGLLLCGRHFVAPAVAVSLVALSTQLVYPTFYAELIAAEPWIVGVITLRNLLIVGVLAWAVSQLWVAAFGAAEGTAPVPVRVPVPVSAPMSARVPDPLPAAMPVHFGRETSVPVE